MYVGIGFSGIGVGPSQRIAVEKVPDQDLHHLHGLVHPGGELGNGARDAAAVQQQRLPLRTGMGCPRGRWPGDETGVETKRVIRVGAASGDRVRADIP